MPFDQNDLPQWNSTGTEQPQTLKDGGWPAGSKPPVDYFNWFFNKVFKALQNVITNAQHKEEKGKPNGYASLGSDGKISSVSSPPDASITTKGITKLNSATDSTVETTAATPKAIKIVNDAVRRIRRIIRSTTVWLMIPV